MKPMKSCTSLSEKMASSLPSLTSNKPCWVRKEKAGSTMLFRQRMNSRKVFSKRMSAQIVLEFSRPSLKTTTNLVECPIISRKVKSTTRVKKLWELFKSCVREFLLSIKAKKLEWKTKSLNQWRTLMISRPSMAIMSLKKLV